MAILISICKNSFDTLIGLAESYHNLSFVSDFDIMSDYNYDLDNYTHHGQPIHTIPFLTYIQQPDLIIYLTSLTTTLGVCLSWFVI